VLVDNTGKGATMKWICLSLAILLLSSQLFSAGEVKWKYATGVIDWSSPLVMDGVVYVGGYDAYLYAVNASDGSLKWRTLTDSAIESSPALQDSIIFIGNDKGNMYAIKLDGSILWTTKVDAEIQTTAGILNNLLFFGDYANTFHCLMTDNGATVWTFTTGDVIQSGPVFQDSIVFFGSNDCYLYALRIADGTLKWKARTITGLDAGLHSTPCLIDSILYVGDIIKEMGGGQISAMRCSDGSAKWHHSMGIWVMASPVSYEDSLIYDGTCDPLSVDNYFACLRISDGSKKWDVGKSDAYFFAGPCVSPQGQVYGALTGDANGELIAYDAYTGDILWKFRAGGMFSAPCYEDSTVYFGCRDGYLYALVTSGTGFKNNASSKIIPSKLQAYPNPFSKSLSLDLPSQASIYSLTGQLIMKLNKGKHNLDTSRWIEGVYIIKSVSETKRVIKIK
jgi:eukaryotic-like serine/threonine-protein kinase